MSTLIIANGCADHPRGHVPLTQQTSHDRGIIKHKLVDLGHDRACVVPGEFL
ncbi:MAG: hypothetical protein U0X92_00995 [Anaerolineales bacterium]